MDAAAVALYLGVPPEKGAAIMRKRYFPVAAMRTADGKALWDIVTLSDWIRTNVKMAEKKVEVCLYRHFNQAGELLYVGISASPMQRTRAHGYAASWFRQVERITVEWHPSRAEAEAAEKHAIRAEKPRFNKAHAHKI